MHFILENVTRELFRGGKRDASDQGLCHELTARYAAEYRSREFNSEVVDGRLDYLLTRLERDAAGIVFDTARELSSSEFEPLDFELDFTDISPGGHPIRGLVDRVDGLKRGGRLYLRIVDYKTGKKAFRLSDILYGLDMQMLIYLFALERGSAERYGLPAIPAGVVYAPARDVVVRAPRNAPESEIAKLREKQLRHTGLMLAEVADPGGADEISGEQINLLRLHIADTLSGIAAGIRAGRIDRDPYYKSPSDNACLYCEYATACRFSEASGDRRRYIKPLPSDAIWARLGEGGGK